MGWTFFACFITDGAVASEPVEQVIQETFLSETVYPQQRYELQLTTRLEWQEDRSSPWQAPLLMEFGITDRWMVEVETTVDFDPGDLEETSAGVLYNFFSDAEIGTAFSTGFSLGFPPENFRYELYLIAYQAFDPVFLNLSGGIELEDEDGDLEVEGEIAFAIFLRPSSWWFPTLEFESVFTESETLLTLAPGVLIHPGLDFEIGMAVPIGLSPSVTAGAMFVVTWEWEFGEDEDEDE